MNSFPKERKFQTEKIQIQTADPGLIGANQICAIISPMEAQKEEIGMKEGNCGT